MTGRKTTFTRAATTAIAAALLLAAPAAAAPRDFKIDLKGGAINVGKDADALPFPVPAGGTVSGTVADDGKVAVPAAGFAFPEVNALNIAKLRLLATGAGTGTFDDATGAMTLDIPVRLAVAGVPEAADCTIGTADAPIRLSFSTAKTSHAIAKHPDHPVIAGKPFDRATGAIRLVDNTFAPPAPTDCGSLGTVIGGLDLTSGNNSLGLAGLMTIPELPKAEQPRNETPAPVVTQPGAPATTPVVRQTAPSAMVSPNPPTARLLAFKGSTRQRGLKSGGAVFAFDLPSRAALTVRPKVKLPGAKAVSLKAFRRSLKAGRASVAVKLPTALRRKAQRALRSGKSVVVTITVQGTDATGATVSGTRTLRISR
jgi:hypothetical protein